MGKYSLHKVIFVSVTANFVKFNLPFIQWFKQQGWQVDYAAPDDEDVLDCDTHYIINMVRSPFSLQNIKAIGKLRAILIKEQYSIIHCHTNIGAMVARFAARNLRKKTGLKVIYTLHGAYFFKKAPLFNWLIYYPIEKYLSHFTDCLILINQEDYDNAVKGLKVPLIYKINSVGLNISNFSPLAISDKNILRKKLGYNDNEFILLYIAEFVNRKNHIYLLKQIPVIKKAIPHLKVIFAGKGILLEQCKKMANSLEIVEVIDFLGYRNDINLLCQISDIHVSVSKMEGLSMNNIEAMACGLPIVCSKIRGHTDAVINERNGFLFELRNPTVMVNSIIKLYKNEKLRYEIAQNNIEDVKNFSLNNSILKMANIYKQFM
jgi:glycosyltransferase EpsD